MSTTTTKERPIIFNGEMVRAILEGRKTQTRRVATSDKCPYGEVGDRLWVREKWRIVSWSCDHSDLLVEYADGARQWCYLSEEADPWGDRGLEMGQAVCDGLERAGLVYHGDEDAGEWRDQKGAKVEKLNEYIPWKPSIHMFQDFSRITLEIVDIRLEALQDISEEDAEAEGVYGQNGEWRAYKKWMLKQDARRALGASSAIESFKSLWQCINGKKEGCAWKDNPLVWVVGFKRVREVA